MPLLERIERVRAVHWIALSIGILAADYATGPFIQIAILFIVPVALATATHGKMIGAAVATALPLIRLPFFYNWAVPSSWGLRLVDAAVDVVILIGFAVLIGHVLRQQRQIRVLEGLLPICSFCKRIRDEGGAWRQLESFIAERSPARFSHTFCPECGRRHYGELAD